MKQPNIVFVFADQMRASALGCAGVEAVMTPNLDKMAGEGTLFTRAISNHPICCPARATILTGLHSQTHGLVTNDQQLRTDVTSIAHHLNDAGYKCGYVGKWHIDIADRGAFIPAGPRRRGFDDLWAVNNCNHAYMNAYYYLNDNAEPVWIEGYEPEAQTDIAVKYIEGKAEEKNPFCLFLSWGTPHCPYTSIPQKYLDMYPPESIQLKDNAAPHADRSLIAGYYAHITALDEQMGRILDTLEKRGLADNTIVVFTSDHGDMLYSQDHGWKMKPWAESVNIPFIARWPGHIPGGRNCSEPIGLVDVMPTLLGLVGEPVKEGEVDGCDLTDLFTGKTEKGPDSQFIYDIVGYKGWSDGKNTWRGVVTKTHTYVSIPEGEWLLYHDAEDPCQLKNRVDDPLCSGIKEDLNKELQRQLSLVDDSFLTSDEAVEHYVIGKVVVSEDKDELIPAMIREYKATHPDVPGIDTIAAEMPYRPDEKRFVRFFENQNLMEGRKGIGRKFVHTDFYKR